MLSVPNVHSSTHSTSSPPRLALEIKRAKHGRWCHACHQRIEVAERYALLDRWTWVHLRCVAPSGSAA